jgi:iron(III) transport system permease protein
MTSVTSSADDAPTRASGYDLDTWFQRLAIITVTLAMLLLIVAPLAVMFVRSFSSNEGSYVGLANFTRYFRDPAMQQSLLNTLILGFVTMFVTVSLALPYAYAVTCSRMPFRKLFLALAMLPLYAPTMLYGLGLYSLFGTQGAFTTGLFNRIHLHLSLPIHGLTGIILSEVLATFPPAVLILTVSLSHRDRRLYEAAASMGASTFRTFRVITLSTCRVGLISAASIAFVLATTDYGAPAMLAERTNVLALDIAQKALAVDSDQSLSATINLVLLIPTVVASAIQMAMRRRQNAALTAKSVPMIAEQNVTRDSLLFIYCTLVAGAILLVTLAPLLITFASTWPYSLYPKSASAFSLNNFNFDAVGDATGGGIDAYWNSLIVAGLTALVGTLFSFIAAYLIERTRPLHVLRRIARAIAIIPLGLPGMVLGLSYVLIFNPLKWGPIPNPVQGLYNTIAILILCNVIHYLGVSFLTASAAITQLDHEFEQVAQSMAVPAWRLFLRVTVPVCTPAIIEIAMYYFVSAMTTVSAVIFLVSPRTPLASVAIVNLKDANLGPAAAMAVLVLLSNIIVRALVEPIQRYFHRRTQSWQAPP